MKKLLTGIIDFRKNVRPRVQETFARLALGQSPDALLIACSDSRVAPNVFASTEPGDLFVVRNVGNLVPPCGGEHGISVADESEAAAIEFSISTLNVSNIIICGHSECGAMQALVQGRENLKTPNLKEWLRHGEGALKNLSSPQPNPSGLSKHNQLSQLNVLQQVENLKSYPIIRERLQMNKLRIHAWWFELANASLHFYDPNLRKFIEIDEKTGQELLRSLK